LIYFNALGSFYRIFINHKGSVFMFTRVFRTKKEAAFYLVICLFLLISNSGCFLNDDTAPFYNAKKYDAATLAAVNGIIDSSVAAGNSCTLAGIWNEGYETLLIAKGASDIATGRAGKITDRFRIASNTKMFTAVGVLMLADRKKIALDDKLSKYLPEIPHSDRVTIRQVANHTAGYFNYSNSSEFGQAVLADKSKAWTPQEIMATIKDKPLDFEPGTKYKYSNTGYIILGLLIEKTSGIKWETFITEKILSPLGMSDTYCSNDIDITGDHINGYGYEGTAPVEIKLNPSTAWAAGCLVSTISDLKKWLDAIRQGALLSPEMQAEHKKWVAAESGNKYGFGLEFVLSNYMGHTGSYPGYYSFVFISLDGKKSVIIVHNIDADPSATAGKIIKYLGM